MEPEPWRILLIEDDKVLASQIENSLTRRPVAADRQRASVDVADEFKSGLEKLKATRYDLVILDIRDNSAEEHEPTELAGDEATSADVGISLYEMIRSRRAVPVIFYSAVAYLVADLANPPFVTVVSKLGQDDNALRTAVAAAIDSRLPALNRALNQYTENVLRIYTQNFVESRWADLQQPGRDPDLARLLARRLAVSLGDGAGLAAELSTVPGPGPEPSGEMAHPMRMYVVPPIGDLTTGDILCGRLPASLESLPSESNRVDPQPQPETAASAAEAIDCSSPALTDGQEQPTGRPSVAAAPSSGHPGLPDYWVMLTPACDLVQGHVKADFVVLARCSQLAETEEAIAWGNEPENGRKTKALDALLRNNRQGGFQADRFHALPPAWDIPGLLVDFQQIVHVPFAWLTSMERVATLDDPYAQALIARFGRYLGRIGTPDLDLSVVRERLRPNM